MKQLYFLFLLLSTTVFSQQKFEFGFAVKAGTATLPTVETRQHTVKSIWRPGFTSQYGVYAKKKIGGQLFLSTELLYQFTQVSKRDRVQAPADGINFSESVDASATTTVWENNLIVPLNLHFSPAKWEKTSLYLSVAAAFHLRSEVSFDFQGYSTLQMSGSYPPSYVCDCFSTPPYTLQAISVYQKSSQQKHIAQVLLGAGIQHRLSEHTSIGAELQISPRKNPSDCRLFLGWDCCAPVLGYKAASRYPIAMRSLSISLHHNILR